MKCLCQPPVSTDVFCVAFIDASVCCVTTAVMPSAMGIPAQNVPATVSIQYVQPYNIVPASSYRRQPISEQPTLSTVILLDACLNVGFLNYTVYFHICTICVDLEMCLLT